MAETPEVEVILNSKTIDLCVKDLARIKAIRKKVANTGRQSLTDGERKDAKRLGLVH